MKASPSISVVIPVLNADRYLPALLQTIFKQKPYVPSEIILVDSQSTDNTAAIAAADPRIRFIPITNFSHGRARNLGARAASGEFVVLMTQDALPRDDQWLAKLLEPLQEDKQVAVTFSRQYPYSNASPMESYFINSHFPENPVVKKTVRQAHELSFQRGIFMSNVSAAYRRELLLKYPFDEDLIMSEDQQIARDFINAGYAVYYQPLSVVFHSHNYTLGTVVRRYFDSVYSVTQIFPRHNMQDSASMGLNYLRKEAANIFFHHPLWIPYYLAYTAAKTFGTVAGHFADHMPRWLLRRLSMHSYHWK